MSDQLALITESDVPAQNLSVWSVTEFMDVLSLR